MKGISTIIATILMLMITLALAGTAYLFISGTLTSKTATAFEIVDSYGDTVVIRNIGTEPITSFRSVKIDDNDAIYRVDKQDTSLVGYWKFDEGSGTTASDSSGKGNTGTLSGSGNLANNPGFETGDPPTGWALVDTGIGASLTRSSAQAKYGTYSMLVTTGTGAAAAYQSPTFSTGTQYTYSAWVKTSTANTARLSYWDTALGEIFSSYHTGDGSWQRLTLTFTPGTTGGNIKLVVGPASSTAYFDDVQVSTGPVWSEKYGAALSFDGSNDYVNVPDNDAFNLGSFTLEAWIKTPDAGSGRRRIVSQQDGGNYWLMALNGNVLELGVYCGGAQFLIGKGVALNDNAWKHVTVVRDLATNQARWYVNGADVGSQSITGYCTTTIAVSNAVNIGRYSAGLEYFNGLIDEVEIYNKALSEQEIKASYAIGSQINAGETATIKIYNPLSKGMHTLRLCTSSMCNPGYLTIQ